MGSAGESTGWLLYILKRKDARPYSNLYPVASITLRTGKSPGPAAGILPRDRGPCCYLVLVAVIFFVVGRLLHHKCLGGENQSGDRGGVAQR